MRKLNLDAVDKLNAKLAQAQATALLIQADYTNNDGEFSLTYEMLMNAFWTVQDLISEAQNAVAQLDSTGGSNA